MSDLVLYGLVLDGKRRESFLAETPDSIWVFFHRQAKGIYTLSFDREAKKQENLWQRVEFRKAGTGFDRHTPFGPTVEYESVLP